MESECNLGGINDVIAPKRSSLKPTFVVVVMLLKLNMSLIPNNPADIVESPFWNTLIPSRLELPNDMDDSDDNENEEDDANDNDDDDEDDDVSPMPVERGSRPYMMILSLSISLCNNMKIESIESNTIKCILFGFI